MIEFRKKIVPGVEGVEHVDLITENADHETLRFQFFYPIHHRGA